jgi:hypothetical protein
MVFSAAWVAMAVSFTAQLRLAVRHFKVREAAAADRPAES